MPKNKIIGKKYFRLLKNIHIFAETQFKSMRKIITEPTPLSDKDCFYLIDRLRDGFSHHLHCHAEYELNLVTGCKGSRRLVGDSLEETPNYDMVLIAPQVEHQWIQHNCRNMKIREICLQFSSGLFSEDLLAKTQFSNIRRLFESCTFGLAFDMDAMLAVFGKVEALARKAVGFERILMLMDVLNTLGEAIAQGHAHEVSTTHNSENHTSENGRVALVQDYIAANYRSVLRLEKISSMAGMTPTSFSRFFKMRTGQSLSEYIIEVRLSHAARMLIDSHKTVAEICFGCGFNNVSNFNRIFKNKKNCSPKEFRETYRRTHSVT